MQLLSCLKMEHDDVKNPTRQHWHSTDSALTDQYRIVEATHISSSTSEPSNFFSPDSIIMGFKQKNPTCCSFNYCTLGVICLDKNCFSSLTPTCKNNFTNPVLYKIVCMKLQSLTNVHVSMEKDLGWETLN